MLKKTQANYCLGHASRGRSVFCSVIFSRAPLFGGPFSVCFSGLACGRCYDLGGSKYLALSFEVRQSIRLRGAENENSTQEQSAIQPMNCLLVVEFVKEG